MSYLSFIFKKFVVWLLGKTKPSRDLTNYLSIHELIIQLYLNSALSNIEY